jgi:hypothetical protein
MGGVGAGKMRRSLMVRRLLVNHVSHNIIIYSVFSRLFLVGVWAG